jgi:DNA-binding LacI/PurR family transcriptional regulator/signal transduction histidine kinase
MEFMDKPKSPGSSDAGKTRPTIGLLIENTSDIGEGYLVGLLAGITATARVRDANLFCFPGGALYGLPDIEFEDQRNILYRIVSTDNLDGLIIISSLGNNTSREEMNALYARYGPLPAVTIGTPIEGVVRVRVDHEKGMAALLLHLIEVHNYRRIAFIRGPEDSPEAERRYQIYQDLLAQYAIPFDPQLVVPGFFRISAGVQGIRILLDERQAEFDVVVAANDHMAMGALQELNSRGIVVPYDVAVVGFDNVGQAKMTVPPLTTVRQPLFDVGKTAVATILARLAGETVAPQVFLPAELVVRRSCGCLPSTLNFAVITPVMEPGESLQQRLRTHREVIARQLVEMVDFSPLDGSEGVTQLLDSFVDEVVHGANGRFLATIDQLLRVVISKNGDMISWQAVVAVLRQHIMSCFGKDALSLHADSLLYDAQSFITGEIRNVEAQQQLRIQRQNWLLQSIGQMLITTFDMEGLMDILANNIPRLGIMSCYLVLYEDPQPYRYPQPPPEWSRLILACNENGRLSLNPAIQRFPTRRLLPADILPQPQRHTFMIEPLHFRTEQIGYVMLERGPREGNVYEVLRGQIASALKGALLLHAHQQAQIELRQHRDHLDELVQEHTTELAAANINLRQEITDRRKIEKSLQESKKNLAYAQTIAQLGYSYWDIQTGEMVWSDELYQILEVDKDDYELTSDWILPFIHPEDMQKFINEIVVIYTEQEIHRLEFRIITSKARVIKHLFLWGETTFSEDGAPIKIFSIFQDITVRQQAELKLEAYTAELERSNQELQEFAYVASHDLQEPLRKIQAFGDRLQQKYYAELDEKGKEYIDRMQNAAARMQALIIALLAFSRVRTHTQPLSKVNLVQVVKYVLQDLETSIAAVGATITVSDLPELEADALQMRQLFQNLLGNALKFHRPGVPLQITVDHRLSESFCEIIIADNGLGFDQQYAERIFTVFERLHNPDIYPGTGVGLAICRRIAERHGGDIRAVSKPGEGTRFIVRLLLKQPVNQYHPANFK